MLNVTTSLLSKILDLKHNDAWCPEVVELTATGADARNGIPHLALLHLVTRPHLQLLYLVTDTRYKGIICLLYTRIPQ
jgi:hypothetical protein